MPPLMRARKGGVGGAGCDRAGCDGADGHDLSGADGHDEPTTRLAVEGASTKKASRLDSTMRLDSTIGILVSIRLKEDSSAGLVFLYRRLNLQ